MKSDRNASAKALLAGLAILTDEEMLAWADYPNKVKEFLAALVSENIQSTYVVALSDTEVLKQFPQFADRLESWRKRAARVDYRGPVAWLVKVGFTLKIHAPLAGPCYKKLEYLQGWNFSDEPTKDCLVFWVPQLAENSTGKSIKQMEAHRAELRQRYELPANHCTSFGSISLLFALILAHFKRTGDRVPLNQLYAASDSLDADGDRLIAGYIDSDGLGCNGWRDAGSNAGIGFFLLGVEELGQ